MDKGKSTILVVEDEELLLQAITRKLESINMQVITCKSGKQALDILNNLDKLPDAIWLDYYLKDMNGLEFMSSIKKDGRFANIPTIVVSNSASPDKVSGMLALGVKKYYLKAEHKLDDIITAVKEFVNKNNKNNGKN